MEQNSKIYVAGHRGMVGSAVVRILRKEGYNNIVTRTSQELDLKNQSAVKDFFEKETPSYVILAAAKVGGIQSNLKSPGQFIYENLQIQNNIIHFSHLSNVKMVVFLGSSCIYPKECPQPMREEFILTGKLEPTNESYAVAKIAGLTMCESYRKQYNLQSLNILPCNLYGPNDSFDLQHSHVLSALVKKFYDAVSGGLDQVTLWGTGAARREFMHVDDFAAALIFLLNNYKRNDVINVGTGVDISIKELAYMVASKVGFNGTISWDSSKPDGMLKKCMDVTKLTELGFYPEIQLEEGIEQMIEIYKKLK